MHNNYTRQQPLTKYMPNSPSSPHEYDEDSFEAEELSRQHPHLPIQHNYELTFKKEAQGQYFLKERPNANRVLFNSPDQSMLLNQIKAPLADYHSWSLQELSNLPFADLMSLELSDMLREKLGLIGEILQVKRMRMKLSSVGVNLKCLRVRQQLTHEDKNRLFLLQLLWKQLSKKIFLEALKLNLSQSKYLRQYAEKEQMHASYQNEMSYRIQQDFLQEQEEDGYQSNSHSNIWQKDDVAENDSQSDENVQQKLMVFTHAVKPIFQKLLFFAFHRISQASQQPHPNAKSTFECESIPLMSRPNIIDDSHSYSKHKPQAEYVEQPAQQEIEQTKLEELYNYIQALHQQCAESDNLQKRYFIKWKIHLLEAIAQSILNQIKSNSMYRHQEQEEAPASEESFHRNHPKEEQQVQMMQEEDNKESRYTSQLSQDGSLKGQKRLLKEYLKERGIRQFFSQFRQYFEGRKISSICVEMRKGNILHKAFLALKQNAQNQKIAREMDGYYSQIANSQYQDDGTSKLFHKTNLLFNYFNRLKQNQRNQRFGRTISSIMLKLVFRGLKSFGFYEQRQNEIVDRHRVKIRNHTLFKCFSIWKQFYLSQNCFNDRFRLHMSMKERQTLQHYFSLLKLQYKRTLLKQRKADHYYEQKIRIKAFLSLKIYYQDSRQLNQRTTTLQGYLLFTRGSSFIHRFQQYYIDITVYQRFCMKEEKLKRMLIRLHALQSIKQWRKAQLRKNAYEAIEMKLVRFKNKQRKREIFGRWLERTQKILYRSNGSSQSQHHKDWLVKYYGDLCSVLPS